MSLLPFVSFDPCDSLAEVNELLRRWKHRMGPLARPCNDSTAYLLRHEGMPVGLATTSGLIREVAGGGLTWATRENTIELSRLCAARPHLCRVVLRLWREFVFPALGRTYALSYQDADIHSGATYRFDGWVRMAFSRHGGFDQRSGRPGRNKWIWLWTADEARRSWMREQAELAA